LARFSIRAGAFFCPRILILSVLAVIFILIAAVSASHAAQVTLAWDPSPEPNVAGYRVYYGTASRYYTAVIDAGNQTTLTISGLAPGVTYFFSATAYSPAAESYLSGEIAYTVPGNSSPASGSGGGGGCFIATAAFGSRLAPEVSVLREFRDRFLLTNRPGQAFVDLYCRFSPPIAAFIKEHDSLRGAVRWGLTPVVYAVKYPGALLALIVLIPFAVMLRKWHRGR